MPIIICLATIISCASVFSNPQSATAENIDVLVSLDDASLLAAYGDLFAYTQGKTICVAKNNKLLSFEEKSDFDEFVDVAINSTHITRCWTRRNLLRLYTDRRRDLYWN